MTPFLSSGDAHRYLSNCIVMYNGSPVWVVGCTQDYCQDGCAVIQHLGSTKREVVKIDSDKFQIFSFELGYLNQKDRNCIYLARSGNRISNYGLRIGSILQLPFSRNEEFFQVKLSGSKEFLDSLDNKYPSFSEAMNTVQSTGKATAFNKHYCIGMLDEEEQIVGIFSPFFTSALAVFEESTGKFRPFFNSERSKTMYSQLVKARVIPLDLTIQQE